MGVRREVLEQVAVGVEDIDRAGPARASIGDDEPRDAVEGDGLDVIGEEGGRQVRVGEAPGRSDGCEVRPEDADRAIAALSAA